MLTVLLALWVCSGLLAPPRAQDLAGRYFGLLDTPQGESRVVRLDLARSGDGWGGTLDLLGADHLGLVLAGVETTEAGVAFEVAAPELGPLWFDAHRTFEGLAGEAESEHGPCAFRFVESAVRTQAELSRYLGWYGEEGIEPALVTWDPYGALVLVDFGAEDATTLLPREDGSFAHWEPGLEVRRSTFFEPDGENLVATTRLESGALVRAPRREDAGFRQELVEYPSGDVLLGGMLLTPRREGPHPALLVLPGSGHQTRERLRELIWARTMLDRGFAVLLFDKRGCGTSGGHWREQTLLELAQDAVAGVRYLASRADVRRDAIGLYGLSQGGHVAPLAANRSDDVAFLIDDSGSIQSLAEAELGFLRGFLARSGFTGGELDAAIDLARLRFESLTGPGAQDEYRRAVEASQGQRWCDARYLGPLELPAGHWMTAWWRSVLALDAEAEWRRLAVPALVLFGAEDSRLSVDDEVAALERIVVKRGDGTIELEVFPDAGHCLFPTTVDGHFVEGSLQRMADFASEQVSEHAKPVRADDTGTGWSLQQLDVEVVLLPEDQRLELAGTMRLRLEREASLGPTIAVNGDEPVMRFVRVDAPRAAAVELESGLRDVAGVRVAHVRHDEPWTRGDEVELYFELASEGGASQLLVTEEIALASWTDAWHPLPIPAAGEALSAKLKTVGRTTFHLPPGWTAPCNGALVEREETEDGVVETRQVDVPVARSFAAGPFHVALAEAGERRVRVHRLQPTEAGEDPHAVAAAAAVEAMEERFGPFPYDDFAIVEVPAGLVSWYAASQQGHVWATSGVFQTGDGNLVLWGHELAHGWWGNLVGTEGPGSLLCSESLAQYGAVVTVEAVEGRDAMVEFLEFSRAGYPSLQCARGYFQILRDGNDRPLSGLDEGGWNHQLSDSKGHWVYQMLRRRIGDELFFATLRGLIADFAGRRMKLDDLRAAFVAAAPADAEVEAFLAQWLDRPGAPILDLQWEPAGDGKEVELTVTQSQDGEPFQLVLEVELEHAGGSERHEVRLRERETRLRLTSAAPVEEVRLDPGKELLIWRPEYGDRPE